MFLAHMLGEYLLLKTQQCVEKSLKGYLAFKEQTLQKSHDIELLVELCSIIDDEFESLYGRYLTL